MIAYVICANDILKAACLDRELAVDTLERLSKEWYVKSGEHLKLTYEDYMDIYYWHIHEVEVIE